MEDFAGTNSGEAGDALELSLEGDSSAGVNRTATGPYTGAELGGPKYYGSTVPVLGQHASTEMTDRELPEKRGGASKVARVTSGVVTLSLGGGSIVFEQLPTNENWRISAGFRELVRTGSASAVAAVIGKITLLIEGVSSGLVILALYSNNPIVEKPKQAFSRWMETGAQRADFRTELKEEEQAYRLRVENNWRVAQGKDPKLTKQEKIEKKQALKDDKLRVENNWRVAQGKDPKVKKERSGDTRKEKVVSFIGKEATDLLIANGLGAGIVVFKNAMSGKSKTVKESIIDAVKATVEISAVSSAIGYLIASGTAKAKFGVPLTNLTVHYEQQAQWLIDYGTDTKALMAILLAAYTPSTLVKLYHRLPKQDAKFKEWLESQLEKTSDSTTELAYT